MASNRNPVFSATLDGVLKVINDAAGRRDGTAMARCEAALMVLSEIAHAMNAMDVPLDAPKRGAVSTLHQQATRIAFFGAIHDQFARGEIDNETCNEALSAARATGSGAGLRR